MPPKATKAPSAQKTPAEGKATKAPKAGKTPKGEGQKGRRKIKHETYSSYIYKVLKQVHPGMYIYAYIYHNRIILSVTLCMMNDNIQIY